MNPNKTDNNNAVVFSNFRFLLSIMFKFMVIGHLSLVIGTKQADNRSQTK